MGFCNYSGNRAYAAFVVTIVHLLRQADDRRSMWYNNGNAMRTVSYTILGLMAFAANSVLCRIALSDGTIDAASFSLIRLASGAATLLLITTCARKRGVRIAGSWMSAAMLFLYAVPFSFAYLSLTTGTGALILFGCVQVTMMSAAVRSGERPRLLEWFGLALALAGLVYLMAPGLAAPPLAGAGLMAVAGVSWGVYSLRGRQSTNPLEQTTSNFVRSVPLVLVVSVATLPQIYIDRKGALFAVASGALASGIGYVVWYRALRGLTAAHAAVVQLAVPILAAAGGVIFLREIISERLIISAALVLGGIGLALFGREKPVT
jgi:drug/metabolite transporter (DMT)-like permease